MNVMIDADKVKGGVIVVLLFILLALFDFYNSYTSNSHTYGAYGQITGAAIASDGEGGECVGATDETAAVKCTLFEGTTITVNVGGRPYEVTADFIGKKFVIFTVEGQAVQPAAVGETRVFFVAGAQLKVLNIEVQDVAGGVRKVEFTFGSLGQQKCTDSDGGNFRDVQGEVHVNDGSQFGKSYKDYCENDKDLIEYYCRDGEVVSEKVSCGSGVSYSCVAWRNLYINVKYKDEFLPARCYQILEKQIEMLQAQTNRHADCTKGEVTFLREGEWEYYNVTGEGSPQHLQYGKGKSERIYDITARSVSSLTAELGVSKLRQDYSVVNDQVLDVNEFENNELYDGTVLRTFTTIVDKQPYGIKFCLMPPQDVIVEPGWNIIGLNALHNLISTTCTKDQISKYVYAYFPQGRTFAEEMGDYVEGAYGLYELPEGFNTFKGLGSAVSYPGVSAEESDKLRKDYPATLASTGAVWLYNYGDACTMHSKIAAFSTTLHLPDGWNMVSVPYNWANKKLRDVLSSCNTAPTGYLFSSGAYKPVNLDTIFHPNDVGKGFWINSDKCSLRWWSDPSETLAAP